MNLEMTVKDKFLQYTRTINTWSVVVIVYVDRNNMIKSERVS